MRNGGENVRRTKIVATVGPASNAPEMLVQLIRDGVDVFRLNYSHGTHEEHARVAVAVREASERAGRDVAILQDLSGPKIRTGTIEGDPIPLEEGATWHLVGGDDPVRPGLLTSTMPELVEEVRPGEHLLLSDGRFELVAEEREGDRVRLRVLRGGLLPGRAGINLPQTRLSVPSLTDKDREDLRHGLGIGVDMMALSFVRRASDLDETRRIAAEAGHTIFLVAKIEKPEAVDNLEGILERADGVMVARGDLGVEIPAEDVPIVQKQIIRAANERRIPVITATQMLESMIESAVPTRAEASDVANAIFDGTDAVMLSGETATGRYPLETVRTMARIAGKADAPGVERPRLRRRATDEVLSPAEAVARAASRAAEAVGAKAIIVYTESGGTARLLSSYRPAVPVLALSPVPLTVRRLRLSWGVYPRLMPRVERLAEMLLAGEKVLVDAGQVEQGDRVVVVSGSRAAHLGGTNMMKIHTVGDVA
jgi:pyruvate kinase